MLNLSQYFTVAAIMKYLKTLPILKTPVMDTVFTFRPQQPLPMIAADLLTPVLHELPMVRRGGKSIPAITESGAVAFYEPFPFRPDKFIKGSDLNNLKVLGESSKQQWAMNTTDALRRIVRKSTEAICAVSLSGTLTWPVKLEGGGFETYTVVYGSTLSVVPDVKIDANGAKVKDVFAILTAMHEALQEKGYGGTLEIWAASDAFNALFALVESVLTSSKLNVGIQIGMNDNGINIGGYLVKRRAEKYRNPQTGEMTPIMPAKTIRMIATDAGHFMPYCALDDLDANLQPLPFFVKPIESKNPSGYQLVAESKPFPVPNVNGICDAVVLQ